MDIPVAWMERLFALLHAQYGNRMTTMWGDCPAADVKDAWRTGLSGVDAERIKAALAALPAAHPEWPPTLGEFLALCRRPVVQPMHRVLYALPKPKAVALPDAIKAKIARLFDPDGKKDGREWARRILKEHDEGTYKLLIGVEMAREALWESA